MTRCDVLRGANTSRVLHSLGMDAAETPPSPASALLATIGQSRVTRVLSRVWWVGAGSVAALAYLSVASDGGVMAPVGGTLFIAGLMVVAAVARNASAEAHQPGSVRRGSLLRAAALGVVVHGGLLAAVTVFGSSPLATAGFVMGGAVLVALTRPTTLVALGATTPLSTGPAPVRVLSVPQLVAELRSTAEQVRATTDPVEKAALAERRGVLLEMLVARDPNAVSLLLDDGSVRPAPGEGPDGPLPA